MFYVTLMLTISLLSNDIILIFSRVTMAGTLFMPLIFVTTDIMAEIYGYRLTRQIILLAFICHLVMSVICELVLYLKHPPFWQGGHAYTQIFSPFLRNTTSSFIAYIVSTFINIHLLTKWRILLKGRYFWLRSIGSSLIGEFIFTFLAVLMIQLHVMPIHVIWQIVLTSFVIKCVGSITCALPANMIVNILKLLEFVPEPDDIINPFQRAKS